MICSSDRLVLRLPGLWIGPCFVGSNGGSSNRGELYIFVDLYICIYCVNIINICKLPLRVHTHYRLMMGLTALTLRSLKSSVMVRLYLTIFELHTICAAFYVILVMVRLYLTIFDYI